MNEDDDVKIVMEDDRIITRKELFKKKSIFHKQLAKMPFKEKIKMLISLQKIVESIQGTSKAIK